MRDAAHTTVDTKRKRMRVFFLNCPRFDWFASAYLILAQNSIQEVFEFEVYHYWLYGADIKQGSLGWITRALKLWGESWIPFRKFAFQRYAARVDRICAPFLISELKPPELVESVRQLLTVHDDWLSKLKRSYGGWSIEAAPTIVITETPFWGGYYGWSEGNLAVISVARWDRRIAVPSAQEFVLRNVQRYALRLGFAEAVGSHYPTRGCTWDFNAAEVDIGAGVLAGYLCTACENGLQGKLGPAALDEVKAWLSQDWVGRVETPGSVAGNLKRVFGYDLARTRGLTRSFWERVGESVTTKALEKVVLAVLTLILAALLTILGLRFERQAHPNQGAPSPGLKLLRHSSARPKQPGSSLRLRWRDSGDSSGGDLSAFAWPGHPPGLAANISHSGAKGQTARL